MLFAGCKKEEGILRVEVHTGQNDPSAIGMWVCKINGINRTDFLTIDTLESTLKAETMTYQGETWEVNIGSNQSHQGVVSATVYLEGDIIGSAMVQNGGSTSYRITIE